LAALLGIGRGPPTEIDARLVPLTQGGDLPVSASREEMPKLPSPDGHFYWDMQHGHLPLAARQDTIESSSR
jgi:hypothetical protein